MKLKNYFILAKVGLLLTVLPNFSVAQLIIKPTFMETTDVSNQGVVAGYENQAGPYFIWNPDTDTTTNIAGAAPGQGVGGQARFSSDGNYISGTNYVTESVSTDWNRSVLSNYNYIFKGIEFPTQNVGFAAGQSLTYNGNGIILKTTDGGTTWSPVWTDTQKRGIESMSFTDPYNGYVCGWNQYCAKTEDSGLTWTALNPGDAYVYTAVDFINSATGIVGAQLDSGFAAYVTADGGVTWTESTGLVGIPANITHTPNGTFFLVTHGGDIQKSTDGGLSWTTVDTISGALLLNIKFYDDSIGIATAENNIYETTDGGATWVINTVSPIVEGVGALWHDVAWIDQNHLVLVATPDLIFESADGGLTWTWANQTLFNGNPALYDIAVTGSSIHVCGSQGNFYTRSKLDSLTYSQMAKYDTTAGAWTNLGDLGFDIDNAKSGGYNISADGTTVVGNSWADPSANGGNGITTYSDAIAWNAIDGLIDLGTLYPNKSTRANAVSANGDLIVGWQDINGPWKSAVWKKNPAGGYFANEFLLIDPNGSATDEYNQLGECSTISADGNWIGGYGDYANNNEPWIWSPSTGVINLGVLPDVGTGYVSGMNADGTVVVGWFDATLWGDSPIPFIWTSTGGLQNLNDYVASIGIPMGNISITVPTSMSNNGQYIAGFGFDPTIGNWGEYFTFRLQLPSSLGVQSNTLNTTTIFPNPTNGILNISTTNKIDQYEVFSIAGQLVKKGTQVGNLSTIDISSLPKGVYILKLASKSDLKSFKIIKN
ncbi:MAG: YCF48-related protein [Weeksellaceae bacterium]|nr:YCF48-related protein [Weeksellaceae bacterium]